MAILFVLPSLIEVAPRCRKSCVFILVFLKYLCELGFAFWTSMEVSINLIFTPVVYSTWIGHTFVRIFLARCSVEIVVRTFCFQSLPLDCSNKTRSFALLLVFHTRSGDGNSWLFFYFSIMDMLWLVFTSIFLCTPLDLWVYICPISRLKN